MSSPRLIGVYIMSVGTNESEPALRCVDDGNEANILISDHNQSFLKGFVK